MDLNLDRVAPLDIGGSDAESDVRLADHFVTTPYVLAALEGKKRIFLGRKGSGKSALWKSLPSLFAGQASVVQLSPDDYPTEVLRNYKESGLSTDSAHTNAWKWMLTLEVAAALLGSSQTWSQSASDSRAELIKVLASLKPPAAASWAKRIRQFNISALGFGFGIAVEDGNLDDKSREFLASVRNLIEPLLREQNVVVAVDRLDDSWDGSDLSKSVMIALLKASKELNDKLSPVEGRTGLRVLTFMRSEIYKSLKFNDKDKFHILEQRVDWSRDLLREMVDKRLPEGVAADDLFEAGRMAGARSAFDYILDRTFLRPREVLQFLDLCIGMAGKARPISRAVVRKAEEESYSGWKVEDLEQEYIAVYPDLSTILDSGLRGGPAFFASFEALATVLKHRIPETVSDSNFGEVLASLFEISVVGIKLDGKGTVKYRAEHQNLMLPTDGGLWVHPSLKKGLELR